MNKMRALLLDLGLSYKKEIILLTSVTSIILIAGVLISVLTRYYLGLAITLALCLAFIYFRFSQYRSMKEKLKQDHEDEFVGLINYIEILLSNNSNIYNAFYSISKYASPWMRDKIENLLKEMDVDTSVQPFINFAKEFNNNAIENLMVSIYQMIDNGEQKDSLLQFDLLFDGFYKDHQETLIARKNKRLESLNAYPLIGSGIIMLTLVVGIISIIGDMINVL